MFYLNGMNDQMNGNTLDPNDLSDVIDPNVWSEWKEMLDKLQKPICRTVGPSLAAFLKSLAHSQNLASLRFLQ